jgi:hypothetical protein
MSTVASPGVRSRFREYKVSITSKRQFVLDSFR